MYRKMLHIICHNGNEKLEECDTTLCSFEWPQSKTLITPNPDKENVEQGELSFSAGGGAQWCRHFPRQFSSFLRN